MPDSPRPDADLVSLTRIELRLGRRPRPRPQGVHQLVWVQNGTLRLATGGGTTDLEEGALVFLAPGQLAALHGRVPDTLVVSVSFAPSIVAPLPRDHDTLAGRFFWADAPATARRDAAGLARLNQAALRLERGRRDGLAALSFLLPLLSDLVEDSMDDSLPDWLATAMAAARDPRVFRDGAAGLVRVAGRAHPHVSRTMRRHTGQTPSDYVNVQRMVYAARRLTGTDDSLAEIAAEIGIPNLSHFHKLFRAHHGQTPAVYRRSRQNDAVGARELI